MTAPAEQPCRLSIRVYIEDTDAGGVVYYVNYLKYMERARTEYLRERGFDKAAVVGDDALFVVQAAEVQYRAPARLDDVLTVTAGIEKITPTRVRFAQQVWRDDTLLCEGHVTVACVDAARFRPVRMPMPLHRALTDPVDSSQGVCRE